MADVFIFPEQTIVLEVHKGVPASEKVVSNTCCPNKQVRALTQKHLEEPLQQEAHSQGLSVILNSTLKDTYTPNVLTANPLPP